MWISITISIVVEYGLIKDIQEVSMQDSFMVWYNVCSLFTNIPISETIDIAVKLILENKKSLKFSENELSCFVLLRHKHVSILMENTSIKLME